MSSQASSAGHAEAVVRQKLVQTGDVDAMIAIRSKFFYTRTVPCELWFFDKGKPEERRDTVLMLDARNVYRKVTRKIYDFSPEQLKNLTSIVWLYRGQSARFLGLVKEYLLQVCAEAAAIPAELASFEASLDELRGQLSAFNETLISSLSPERERTSVRGLNLSNDRLTPKRWRSLPRLKPPTKPTGPCWFKIGGFPPPLPSLAARHQPRPTHRP